MCHMSTSSNQRALLIQYFYEGLMMMDRSMIDAVSGGALMDKMPTVVKHMISNMTSNTQRFGIRRASPSRTVNEIGAVDHLRLENQVTKLTLLVRQLAVGRHQPNIVARICGICTFVEHPTNMCPTLQETESDHLESAIVSAKYESRAIPSPKIQTQLEHALDSSIPTTTTIESTTIRKLPIFGGLDEAVGNKQSGVLANYELQQHTISSDGYGNLPSLKIPNPRGNASVRITTKHTIAKTNSPLPKPAGPRPIAILKLNSLGKKI
ncbi:hypothetical protein CR513_25365, partial [Mucuna pruriens]